MSDIQESLFEHAMERYKSGAPANDLIQDFERITETSSNNAAGWTCLAWLQLLLDRPEQALRSARISVRLNAQDPQARINLSLALLETNSNGVRDHIDFVKRSLLVLPELQKELRESIEDGFARRPDWPSLKKIKLWLEL